MERARFIFRFLMGTHEFPLFTRIATRSWAAQRRMLMGCAVRKIGGKIIGLDYYTDELRRRIFAVIYLC